MTPEQKDPRPSDRLGRLQCGLAPYRQTVLTVFQQVEDHLVAVRIYSAEIRRQQETVTPAQEYQDVALSRYQTGIDPFLHVLAAQCRDFKSADNSRVCRSGKW